MLGSVALKLLDSQWWTSPSFLKPFKDAPFILSQSQYCHLLAVNPFTYGMFQSGVLKHSTGFPFFCLPCCNLFAVYCWYQFQNKHNIFWSWWYNNLKLLSFYHFCFNLLKKIQKFTCIHVTQSIIAENGVRIVRQCKQKFSFCMLCDFELVCVFLNEPKLLNIEL